MAEMICFLDIETIPTQSASVIEKIRAGIKPPGSIKKPESIAAWHDENGPQALAEAVAKTSFDPAKGHVCTVAWAFGDDEIVSLHAETVEQEPALISAFFERVSTMHRVTWCGHYISGFDLRFLLCRAVVLGIKIPQCIPRDIKPWGGQIFDTMTAWAGARDTISMDNLCEALGIEGKGDFSGADVAETWRNGDHERIATYCRDDVHRTRLIWQAFQSAGW